MTALQQARAHLALLLDALDEGDLERAHLLGHDLVDDLDRLRPRHPALADHCCTACESTCDDVSNLRRAVRALEDDLLRVSYALRERRELVDMAAREIDAAFPMEAT